VEITVPLAISFPFLFKASPYCYRWRRKLTASGIDSAGDWPAADADRTSRRRAEAGKEPEIISLSPSKPVVEQREKTILACIKHFVASIFQKSGADQIRTTALGHAQLPWGAGIG
jgi:hypothetical protein